MIIYIYIFIYFLSALGEGCDEDPQRNGVVRIREGGHRQPEFDFGVAQTVHLGGIKSPDHVFVVRVAQLERKADHLRSQNRTKLRHARLSALNATKTRKMLSKSGKNDAEIYCRMTLYCDRRMWQL